jgi:tetratricopeptide (TPR) repeat protein
MRLSVSVVLAAGLLASLACVADPGLLLGPGNGVADWVKNAVAGSGVEQALFRVLQLPGGDVLYRRSPRETRPELTTLLGANPNKSALYALRGLEDERALDFDAAEKDWRTWAQKADDPAGANLDLANFYERRLRPQDELAALAVVGASPAAAVERLTAPADQRAWKAWEKSLDVVDRFALPRAAAAQIYANWERRYPQVRAVYQKELDFALAGKEFAAASATIDRYRKALPADREFPVTAAASLEAARSGDAAGAVVYERSFEPLWPASLVESYMTLLTANHGARRNVDLFRARLEAHPEGGTEALKDAARLFYLQQKLGQLDAAKAALAGYRQRKEAHGAAWSAEELATLGALYEQAQDFPEAAHYFYALAAQKATGNDEERGLAGLARILLTAPEQPLRLGAGNLALYKSIAAMDRGPGYWNGILSLWMNSTSPSSEYQSQDQLATPYFHRAKAAQIVAEIDRRFPQSADRPELHERLISAYLAYGEDGSALREGVDFLTQFPGNAHRVEVALMVADLYSRSNQTEKEIALYRDLLKELAAPMDGVPLGESGARSADYQRVLDRALSRLVELQRLPDALALLRGELDRNPNDPGLYEKLAQFLEQNQLNAHQEEVYQKAIAQFQQTGAVEGWYGKLARFYLRQRRNQEYSTLTRKVTGIFSGVELERYLRDAPAPDASLAYEVELYAHQRFPHDLTFVHDLLSYHRAHRQYGELEKLLWKHWWEEPALRDELFERLGSTGRLDAQLAVLKQQAPELDRGDWNGLARTNPAAERFWVESCLWNSHFEEGVAAAESLAVEYPADAELGETAASLERSLAYFHPEATDKAVAIEARLLRSDPGNLERMARIGDIYADRGRMAEAAPYWTRMAEVHPGDANGYLQSATVFWDYFDFRSALTQLQKGRDTLKQPALYSYEAGAIHESQGEIADAVKEYAAGALAGNPSADSRARFLALARRPEMVPLVEAESRDLLHAPAPTAAAIELRVAVLDVSHRASEIPRELSEAVAHADSFAVLDALAATARERGLNEVEEAALRRQIALTEEPVHKLELRYQLVDLLARREGGAAAAEVDAIYREHPRILGVVRSTVDYDWDHERRVQAVQVLEEAAASAYPDLKDQFQLEAGRKLTDLGDYSRAGKLLAGLLERKPLDAGAESAQAANLARAGDSAALEEFYKTRLALLRAAAMDRGERTNRVAQLRRGMIAAAAQLGHWDQAVDQYIELINAFPGDQTLVEEAALAAGAHGQRDKLVGFYRKTVEDAPRDARWAMVLGQIDTALEDLPAAIDAYGKAIHVRPEQKDLYIARAGLYERLHRLDQAIGDYETLYKLSYRDPAWKLKEAEARARQGRNPEAVQALEEAWIQGHPATAADQFRVAAQLEQWNLLDEARSYAERGVEMAGQGWLLDSTGSAQAASYARILTRLRRTDEAFNRLAMARMQAEQTSVDTELSGANAGSGVTLEEWRNRLRGLHRETARNAFAAALQAMGTVVANYATPEEKEQFAAWLQGKLAGAADGGELRAVYLPAIDAAGLKPLEADLLWQFTAKSGNPGRQELREWLELQQSRVQWDDAGKRIEDLAGQVQPRLRSSVLEQAAQVYKVQNDRAAELRVLTELDTLAGRGGVSDRYFDLLLDARPNDLLARANRDEIVQKLLEKAKPELALAAVEARGANLPPVWKSAMTGLAGLYLRVHRPVVRQGFEDALQPDLTIGERIDHPLDRAQHLAGEIWFSYASRYGEYLDEEQDPRAEGLLEAELEHTPVQASAYSDLADYLAEAGRPDAALADDRHALDLNHDQPAVLDAMALLYLQTGRKPEAIAAWKQAVHLLGEEMDARHVPESFWNDFAQVLEDAAAHGAYAELAPDVDTMLRVYIRRNGSYRTEPLLRAGYAANSKSLAWLLNAASQSKEPDDYAQLLRTLAESDWVVASQRTQLQAREVENLRAAAKPGEQNYELDYELRKWVQALVRDREWKQVHEELARIPTVTRMEAGWLELEVQLAQQEGTIPELLNRWKKNPAQAPAADTVQRAAALLNPPGRRALLRFVYEDALEKRQLTAVNFLGLAEIDLEEGGNAAAVDLLKRLTLTGSDLYSDTDAAAALLEKHGRAADAVPFLAALAEAFPWQARYRVRLAVAQLAVDPHNSAPLPALAAVAADPKALYADRLAAAQALRGHATASIGSRELDLMARNGCIAPEEANHPYFVAARLAAAACTRTATQRESLLRAVIADVPENQMARLRYVQAAAAAGQSSQALLAAAPLLENNLQGLMVAEPVYGWNDRFMQWMAVPGEPLLKPEERNRLLWDLVHARQKRGENDEALQLIRQLCATERDATRLAAAEKERDRMQTDIAREEENNARAPMIHRELAQDRVVRPRLLPGVAFKPRKSVPDQEVAE